MTRAAATRKGTATREMIVERAFAIASRQGLEGVSIGELAAAAGMSKSGVFAHFGAREDLLATVLDWAGERFVAHVLRPAMARPRGLARLQAIVDRWIDWIRINPDGCVILGAVVEYDGRPGPMREHAAGLLSRWNAQVEYAVRLAIDTGELAADTDPGQIAFELLSLMQGAHHGRLYDPDAVEKGARAVRRLIAAQLSPH